MARKKAKGPSKLQLVRDVVAELGKDVMPKTIQETLKAKHGVEMSTSMASTYKGMVLKEGRKKAGGGEKKMGRPTKAATKAPVSSNGRSGSISLDDIKAVKALAEKIGTSKLRELAEVLA